MKSATYYNPSGQPAVQLDVLATNEDGTVDLGRVVAKKPVVVIGKCRVSKEPAEGQCVLEVEAPSAPKSDGAPQA